MNTEKALAITAISIIVIFLTLQSAISIILQPYYWSVCTIEGCESKHIRVLYMEFVASTVLFTCAIPAMLISPIFALALFCTLFGLSYAEKNQYEVVKKECPTELSDTEQSFIRVTSIITGLLSFGCMILTIGFMIYQLKIGNGILFNKEMLESIGPNITFET